ncbi:MAG: hypothetical protein SPL73_05625 [Cyanobacteriota bacterium]|nr:hypothetical protein [Cyanobacteriota bacterium]MDY6364351.1 hypothetical protein [Cyanobacteriota bacterium]
MTKTDIKINVANDEESSDFNKKLADKRFLPVTHTVMIKAVDFVNMEEFNNEKIRAVNITKLKREYIKTHSKLSDVKVIAREFASRLTDNGLNVELTSVQTSDYIPAFVEQLLDALKSELG